ncbi:TetR family transcriptional regulator [Streptomyces mashuensis]|uniref:TetR family transcriptional regulator n=1 Tax=Streptomyces mashuensis TaxID=33904 RepID=A0A919B3U5_9ACTN|nr:TetR/AcrR family transcriptional regulator C-terminal domain-containing protein [Streptomyces mashuensis]GHF48386.1 TetR family transcriptional regulator [Streptomyces mashuensis]
MASRIDRAKVTDTALRLLNEGGLDGLTLRRIAQELDVRAPALYWHFANKQELLDDMATEMMRRMLEPLAAIPEDAGWEEHLTEAARVLRRALLGYRDGGKAFSGTRFTENWFAIPLERFLKVWTEQTGSGVRRGARAWYTAHVFTMGYVIEEQSVYPEPGKPRDPQYDLDDRARTMEGYPMASEAGWEFFEDLDRGYEEGLAALVAGLAATAAVPGP